MIELGTRPVVLFQAAPFCFGPVSTNLAIAEELRKFDVAIVWLANGTALELLEAGGYADYVVPFDIRNADDRAAWAYLIEEADLVVVNTDAEFADYAKRLNSTLVYIDILYWMWDKLPKIAAECDLYVYEDFVRSDEQEERLGKPANALRIAPLVSPTTNNDRRNGDHLLVSLGGLHRPGGQSRSLLSAYEQMVKKAILTVLEEDSPFDSVHIAGGQTQAGDIVLGNGTRVTSGCLSREDHHSYLASARAAVVSPGLTTFYEAASLNIPTFYLPPHNYSQYLQLESYKEFLSTECYADWAKLGLDIDLPCFLPEAEMLEVVDSTLSAAVNRGSKLVPHLRTFLAEAYSTVDTAPVADVVARMRQRNSGGSELVAYEIRRRLPNGRGIQRSQRNADITDQISPPKKVTLEMFGACQLRCPLCPTGQRRPGRAKGPLRPETVEALLDQIGSHVEEVDLFNWGEPFLNKDACTIIRMISDRGIRVTVSSNLQHIPDPSELVNSGLSELIVSCHGYTQEVYEIYMVGGKVQKTLDNLDRILSAAGPKPSMRIVLRYVVFAHNEHELPLIRDRFEGTAVVIEEAPMRIDMREEILASSKTNLLNHGDWVPQSSRFYDKAAMEAPRSPVGCNLPFEETVIDVDGAVSMCCSSYDHEYSVGNFLRDGFDSVWNGELYREARRVVTGRGETGAEQVICRRCKNSGYRDF